MRQAIIYTRYSPRPENTKKESMDSCEIQLDKCRDYCKANDYEIAGEFADKAISGKNTDNRPGLNDAMKNVCRINGTLVVYSLSRFARSTKDAINLTDMLDKQKADLAIVTQRIDTSTALGRAFFKIMAVIAELERETTSERTSDMMLIKQSKGWKVSDRVPWGTKVDPENPKRLIKNQDEIRIAAVICRMKNNENCTFYEIAKYLNEKEIKPRIGVKFQYILVQRIYERFKNVIQ